MAMEKFTFGNLPIPPSEYSPEHLRQFIRVLELYFNQLDSLTPNQAESYRADNFYGGTFSGDVVGGDITADSVDATTITSTDLNVLLAKTNDLFADYASIFALKALQALFTNVTASNVYADRFYGDGKYITTEYNQFQSNQNQTAGALGTAYAVTMNIDDYPNGITIVNNSEITFNSAGVYLITYSIQFENTTNSSEHVDIWLRYEGSDVASSNSRFGIPARKSSGSPSQLIAVTPYVIDVVADGDQVQIMWHPSDLGVSIKQYAAVTASPGVTPAIPATPSVIVTVAHVSAQHPAVQRVSPLPVFGFGRVGAVTVTTNLG